MKRQNWELGVYAPLIDKILKTGQRRATRNIETYSIFGEQIEIDLNLGFPLLFGRKMFYKPVLGEFAAFIRGPKNVADFQKFGCNYWNDWGAKEVKAGLYADTAREIGDINVDYGNAWIDWEGVNQIERVIKTIKENPADRRLIVSGWRPDRLEQLSLPCCHLLYQWYVRENYLDMVWYQRSVDTMVGLPSDVILCALWNILLANECGLKPGVIKLWLGDTHIYANHLQPTLEYLRQLQNYAGKISSYNPYSTVGYTLKDNTTLFGFTPDMIEFSSYQPQPSIKFELNV